MSTRYTSRIIHHIVFAAMIFFLIGCGQVSLSITDAPIDNAEAVEIVFTGVEIQPETGSVISIDFQTAKTVNLLDLNNGLSEKLLTDEPLEEGKYSSIKLKIDIDNSFITIDGTVFPLRIPDGAESGLQVARDFTVSFSGSTDLIIDFDLRKSLFNPEDDNSDYVLRPTLRLLDINESGSISGQVDASLLSSFSACFDDSGTVNADLYVFSGADITPNDIDGSVPVVVTSTNILADMTYKIGYLEAGDYTVSLTCEADLDDPATNDSIFFIQSNNVSVNSGQDSILGFSL